MNTQSDTPRTDAAQTPASTGDADDYSPMMVCADFARGLERETVAIKAQRDQLLEALKGLLAISSGTPNPCGHDFHCVCAYDAARAAISSVDGGNP